MQTYEAFATIHGLTLNPGPARSKRNDGNAEGFSKDATHYHCTLSGAFGSMSFWYSMGSAHKSPPAIGDVLNSLAGDSRAAEMSFKEWCREYDYDDDSIKAKKIYEACVDAWVQLNNVLGLEGALELLNETSEDGE